MIYFIWQCILFTCSRFKRRESGKHKSPSLPSLFLSHAVPFFGGTNVFLVLWVLPELAQAIFVNKQQYTIYIVLNCALFYLLYLRGCCILVPKEFSWSFFQLHLFPFYRYIIIYLTSDLLKDIQQFTTFCCCKQHY